MALLAVLALFCRKSDIINEFPEDPSETPADTTGTPDDQKDTVEVPKSCWDDTGATLPDYLQSIISIIIRSAAFIPEEPMEPRLRMVFSTSSSMMPSVEGMHVPRSASTAD